jgi:DNA topoisomerase-2
MTVDLSKKYRKLDDVDHVLLRPGMYIGSIKNQSSSMYLLDEGKLQEFDVTYNPGFIKLFDEIITNSVDEHKRKGTKLNTIEVVIDFESGRFVIRDNGGIHVEMHPTHKEWIPEMIFSNLKAGSNFNDDEDRIVGGTHGVGATIVNIFSKEFTVRTADGKNEYYQVFSDNMRKRTKAVIKPSTKHFTEVSFLPEYSRFDMKLLDEVTFDIIKKRVIDILNNETYKYPSFRKYAELYVDPVFYEKSERWQIGIGLSNNGFKHVSFVNTIETKDGGTHVDYILNQILYALREKIKKKYKIDVKPSELKNHMFLFIECTVVNSSFNAQTKEKLITESKQFGSAHIVSEKLIAQIFESEIIQSVLDWVERKKAAEEKRDQRALNKSLDKINVVKLIDAKSRFERHKCTLAILEGDSAASAVRKNRDAQFFGAYPLMGKFINVSELTNAKIMASDKAKNLMASVGLKLGEKATSMTLRYGKIYIYTDADVDGNCIAAQLINFFAKFWPELFDNDRIFKVMTPIVVVKKGKEKLCFYSADEYDEWESKTDNLKSWNIEYKKGLAALEDEEYSDIIHKPHLIKITKDSEYLKTLKSWFAGDSSDRKEMIAIDIVNKNNLF